MVLAHVMMFSAMILSSLLTKVLSISDIRVRINVNTCSLKCLHCCAGVLGIGAVENRPAVESLPVAVDSRVAVDRPYGVLNPDVPGNALAGVLAIEGLLLSTTEAD